MAAPAPVRQVSDQVLRWLWNALSNDYRDVNRAYQDVAHTLNGFPTLAPKTDVYTFENGSSALLLQLHGTLPVSFRGTTYRFPLTIWIPHTYPTEAPYIFVVPTQDMAVRPGQHISVEGRVYHPYLAQWATHWDRSNIAEFLAFLRDVFSKEPPVTSRQQVLQRPQSIAATASPLPVPPHPRPQASEAPAQRPSSTVDPTAFATSSRPYSPSGAPPRPPKDDRRYQSPPPLPQNGTAMVPRAQAPPPVPPHLRTIYDRDNVPISPMTPLGPPRQLPLPGQPQQRAGSSSQHPSQWHAPQSTHPPPGMYAQQPNPYPPQQQHPHPYTQQPPQPHPHQQAHIPPRLNQPQQQKQPALDLLSSPLDIPLPSKQPTNQPPPPIPPNPEKDALLSTLSTELRNHLTLAIQQNQAALPSLQAQNDALQAAYNGMQQETAALAALEQTLAADEQILRDSIAAAERQIAWAAEKRAGSGHAVDVDEVLVAPTTVAEQLYQLVADARGIEAAMFALQRTLERGRISSETFVRLMRGLAREQFKKMALVRKAAQGMGLDMSGMMA